jgi:hypothetical protein
MFAPPSTSPFPPGGSPFRQKGNGYLGDFEFFEKSVPGGKAAVLDAVTAEPMRAFLSQTFRSSEWYDAYPCAVMHATAARLKRQPFEVFRKAVGAYHANEARGGIYRTLLRMISTETVALWAPRISAIYFEFGKRETHVVGPREVLGTWTGVPAALAQFVAFASCGLAEETLRVVGASRPRVDVTSVRADAETPGQTQALYTLSLRLAWG